MSDRDAAARAVSSHGRAVGVIPEDRIISTTSRPAPLDIPDSARQLPRSAPWSQMATADVLHQGAASLVGVSMGREQTRMTSPSTPAAEKSAAFDRMNNYGFFDSTADEAEQLAGIKEDDREALAQNPDREQLALPSPWISGPQVHVESDKEKNRSRAGSLFSGSIPTFPSLPNLNMKQMWQDFNPPSFSEALHKFAPLSVSKDPPSPSKRNSRSNSLFANRMSWNPGSFRRDGASSPRRTSTLVSHSGNAASAIGLGGLSSTPEGPLSPKSNSPERSAFVNRFTLETESESPDATTPTEASEFPTSQTDGTSQDGIKPPVRPRPTLRRSASDTSMLSKTSTVYSFDADPDQFAHIDSMVNSRAKAVKDSWQDSSFRLKNISRSGRKLSFKPDFLRGAEDGSITGSRALSSIFGDERNTRSQTRSLTPPDRIHSPKLSRHPTLDTVMDDMTGDVLVMGGYRGSILRSAEDSRQLWVPFKVGLNVRKVNLQLGLEPEDEETEHTRIYASGILSHIGPIDISRRLIRRFKNSASVREGRLRLHDYGYDWRLSPELLGRRLIEYVERLPCNQPNVPPELRGATIIAHSLGGLITRWAVNHRPELFAGIVYAGVPQHCINILGPLRNGDDVLLSSRVLTAQVNFTLRTSYALLPESGRCFIDKETKEEYLVNFFDVNDWQDYRLSPCVGDTLPALEKGRDRKGSLLQKFRDSTPSLAALTNSSSNVNEAAFSSNQQHSPSPPSSPKSHLRNATDNAERKAGDLAHPHNNTMQPTMQPSVSGPATTVTLPRDRCVTYLRRTLADTLRFKRSLAHNPSHEESNAYPPLSVLYSTCVPTVYGALVSGRDGIRRADAYDNLAFAAGDGVVLARASMLPRGYTLCENGRVLSDRGHVGLLGDLEGVGKCLMAVTKARREMRVGLGKS